MKIFKKSRTREQRNLESQQQKSAMCDQMNQVRLGSDSENVTIERAQGRRVIFDLPDNVYASAQDICKAGGSSDHDGLGTHSSMSNIVDKKEIENMDE